MEALYANSGFYAVVTDISSFLPILACALKLPIYATNDKQIRREVRGIVVNGRGNCWLPLSRPEIVLITFQVKRNICSCLQKISHAFPFLPSSVHLKRKLYDPIDEDIRMHPPRTQQPYIEVIFPVVQAQQGIQR